MRIVTHAGPAHRDEFIAISLLLFEKNPIAKIERKNPTEEELQDPNVYVVDVGKKYEPELNNFDHHQFERGTRESALSLVAKHLGLHEKFEGAPWYQFSTDLDSMGPFFVAKEYYGMKEIPQVALSPVESFLLEEFSQQTFILDNNELFHIMYRFGKNLIEKAEKFHKAMEWFRDNLEIIEVDGLQIAWTPTDDSYGFKEYCKRNNLDPAIHISFDNNGEGMTFFRTSDDKPVDFRIIKDNPSILFAHTNGFLAKTKKRMRQLSCIDLCKKSVIKEKENV